MIKGEAFEVEVEFTGWAARYVTERVWSLDQEIQNIGPDKIRLLFAASSEPEVISWVLSFGDQARLLKPESLVSEIASIIAALTSTYAELRP